MSVRGTVCRKPGPQQYPGTIALWYGRAYTGQPFHLVTIVDPPETTADARWLHEQVLCRVTPDGMVRAKPETFNALDRIARGEEAAHAVVLDARGAPVCRCGWWPTDRLMATADDIRDAIQRRHIDGQEGRL